ncbi:MAG TPA: hypothetical protein VF656_19755 [Pyrinomonadaceae bacterium]
MRRSSFPQRLPAIVPVSSGKESLDMNTNLAPTDTRGALCHGIPRG